MCTPQTMFAFQAGGSLLHGMGQNAAARAQASQLEYEAAGERDTAKVHAERILKATRKERGAARAQIAANGTALDEFALINEQGIQEAGELDAAMAILTGERRGRSLEAQARMTRAAGRNAFLGSIVRAGGQLYSGWKGAKAPTPTLPEMNHED